MTFLHYQGQLESPKMFIVGQNIGAGEEVNGKMLGLKSWMVRTQKKLGFEAGAKGVRK